MNDALNQLLADEFALYVKTLHCHWNVTGPHFVSLHGLLEKHYLYLVEVCDDVAEILRARGAFVTGTMSHVLKTTKLQEFSEAPFDVATMLDELIQDHTTLLATLDAGVKAAQTEGDTMTEDHLVALMQWHRKQRWMLRSTAA